MRYEIFKAILVFLLITIRFEISFCQEVWPDKVYYSKGNGLVIGDESVNNNDVCYSWRALPSDPMLLPLHSSKITVRPFVTTTYIRTAIGNEFSSLDLKQITIYVLDGLSITVDNDIVCDGEQIALQLNPIPAGVPRKAFMNSITNILFSSKQKMTSFGNPSNKSALSFESIDDNGKSKIPNAIWYSTQLDHCNVFSSYEINAVAEINESLVRTETGVDVNVGTDFGAGGCLDGGAQVTQYFSGVPKFSASRLPNGKWEASFEANTFKRDVKGSYYNNVNKNSQYFNLVESEEIFHVGQYEGTTSNLFDDLYSANKIVTETKKMAPFIGASESEAINVATEAFLSQFNAEISRSETIYGGPSGVSRRCQLETEAKISISATFRLKKNCAYPNCL